MAQNPVIKYFPASTSEREVCPGFYYTNVVSGCPHQCSYCFIQGTSFGRIKGRNTISIAPYQKVRALAYKFLSKPKYRDQVLGLATETGDILALPEADGILQNTIRKFNSNTTGCKLLILSKANRIEVFFDSRLYPNNIILSFSVNPPEICRQTKSPVVDFGDLARLWDAGYKNIRLRIDPIIPVPGWYDIYLSWLKSIPSFISRITLGTLRFTDVTHNIVSKAVPSLTILTRRTDEGALHPWRIRREIREVIYGLVIPNLQSRGFQVGLCKEHKWFYELYDIDPKKCNCLA